MFQKPFKVMHPLFQNIFDSHENAQKVALELAKPQFPIEYKGYSIVEDYDINPYSREPKYMFYPTSEGEQHDADCRDGESYTYTGNCKWADSIEEAKNSILEKIMTEQAPYLVETTIQNGGFKLKNITKFWWINDAIRFAALWNGTPLFTINSI